MFPFRAPPVIVGHRGAPREAPENTPEGFAVAASVGAQWVELDVRRSGDGVAVVHHDPWTADGVAVVDRDGAALRQAGLHGLDEVLDRLPAGVGVDVDLKNLPGEPDYDEAGAVAGIAAEALRPRVGQRPLLVSSFNPATLVAVAELLPDVPTGLLHAPASSVAAAQEVALELGARVLCSHVGAAGMSSAGIGGAHAAGLAVLVWPVDDVQRARALAAAGADALCTNDPRLLVRALRARLERL
ncbi:MAG: glycerophosphodiester phosphodiesterase [Actinomycetota bacterium]|nr:glycerophosphodiester phosphodiesterase [Actinomycetota bacterium]